jgi:retron-type reverse transcriptase
MVFVYKLSGFSQNLSEVLLDLLIQQAILQVLQAKWDRTFSEHSYGYLPQTVGTPSRGTGANLSQDRL